MIEAISETSVKEKELLLHFLFDNTTAVPTTFTVLLRGQIWTSQCKINEKIQAAQACIQADKGSTKVTGLEYTNAWTKHHHDILKR